MIKNVYENKIWKKGLGGFELNWLMQETPTIKLKSPY